MAKEITKAYILQELEDRFALREFTTENFLFSETVSPVYNIEPHLKAREGRMKQQSITAIGGVIFETVPSKQRWTLHGYNVVFVTGAYTVAGTYYSRKNNLTYFQYLDLTAAQTVSYSNFMPKDIVLDSGDQLGVNIDGYTTTGNLRLYCDIDVEFVR